MFKVVNLGVLFCSLICFNAYSMDQTKARVACEAAAIKRYQTIRKDQYGSTTGTKINDVGFTVTYGQNMTKEMGYGNNYLSIMRIWGERIERGNFDGFVDLEVYCITNEQNKVIGMETVFR